MENPEFNPPQPVCTEPFNAVFFAPPFANNGGQSFSIPLFGFDDETGKIRPEPGGVSPSHITIPFVRGHKDKSERQIGVLTEHVLAMLIERQSQLNSEFPSPEGDITLSHLRSALHAQTYRAVDRTQRGVLNRGKV